MIIRIFSAWQFIYVFTVGILLCLLTSEYSDITCHSLYFITVINVAKVTAVASSQQKLESKTRMGITGIAHLCFS
jgi:hypothetical protein